MKISRNTWLVSIATVVAAGFATTMATHSASAHSALATIPPAVTMIPSATAVGFPKPVDGRLGALIPTGLKAGPASDWVIYGVPVRNKFNPDTTFGFAMAERDGTGKIEEIEGDNSNYEGDRGELAPGFHVPEIPATLLSGAEQPAYGYFVGDPAKITGTVDGRTFVARTARWSADATVTVFWFDNTQVTGSMRMTGVTAYDATGKQLAKAKVYNYGE
jgi:hypothetical protein